MVFLKAQHGQVLADLRARIERQTPLSPRQRQLADFLLERYTEAAFMTARELGTAVGLSESSVVRFSQRLGFGRFQDLSHLLGAAVNQHLDTTERLAQAGGPPDAPDGGVFRKVVEADLHNLMAVLQQTPAAAFEQAVDMLTHAGEIYVVGLRSAEGVAGFLGFGLELVRPEAAVVRVRDANVLELLSRVSEQSVVVGVSVARYARGTVEALELAGERGARRIALTDGYRSPLSAHAECVLMGPSQIPSFVDSFVACMSIANALVTAVGLARKQVTMHRLAELEQLWARHKVYYRAN